MTRRDILSSSLSVRVIEHLRQNRTQAEIARMLGVSEGFISLVKNRERSLTISHLERIEEALSVPLGALLLSVTEPKNPSKDSQALAALSQRILESADRARAAILKRSN